MDNLSRPHLYGDTGQQTLDAMVALNDAAVDYTLVLDHDPMSIPALSVLPFQMIVGLDKIKAYAENRRKAAAPG